MLPLAVALLSVLGLLFVTRSAARHEFPDFFDDSYVAENHHVLNCRKRVVDLAGPVAACSSRSLMRAPLKFIYSPDELEVDER
jgi:hypothetical protein